MGLPGPLLRSELIAPSRSHNRILMPEEIPLHPLVFKSNFAYSQPFVDEVCKRIPKGIREDISIIEKELGIKLGVELTSSGLKRNDFECRFRDYRIDANYRKKCVDVIYGSSNIAIDYRENERRIRQFFDIERHPMDIQRLKEYAFNENEKTLNHVVWYVHNVHDDAYETELFFRNFAIEFNNMGLENVGVNS